MKKYFYLLAVIFAMCTFTACNDDDDDKKSEAESALVGTWNLKEQTTDDNGMYYGSVNVTWNVPAGTNININMSGYEIPMDINETIVPLVNSMGNMYLPQVLKSVTFEKNGNITAVYKDLPEDSDDEQATRTDVAASDWKTATGYATYKVVDDTHITLFLNASKIVATGEDAEEKAMLKNILDKFGSGIPVNVRWNADKSQAYFYVDKAFVEPIITSLNQFISQFPTTGLDDDTLESLKVLKGVVAQLPEIMNKTTAFEAGLELVKQK